MNWYYASEGRQVGPLNEQDLKLQVAAGVIRADTLVWHDGMAGWLPYGSVSDGTAAGAPVPQPTCTHCGRPFAAEEMIRFGDRWVCASCKPAFVQGLKEGAIAPEQFRYGGFWIRFAASSSPTASRSGRSCSTTCGTGRRSSFSAGSCRTVPRRSRPS